MLSGFVGFALMGMDKSRAKHGEWRVSERRLLTLAIIGGVFGVLVGGRVFHHKTIKDSYTDVVYVAAVAWLAILLTLARTTGPPIA